MIYYFILSVFLFTSILFYGWDVINRVNNEQKILNEQVIKNFSNVLDTLSILTETTAQQIENSQDVNLVPKLISSMNRYEGPMRWIDILWVGPNERIVYSRLKGGDLGNIYLSDREFLPLSKTLTKNAITWSHVVKSRYLMQDIIVLFKSCYSKDMKYMGSVFVNMPVFYIFKIIRQQLVKQGYIDYLFLDKDFNVIFSSQDLQDQDRLHIKQTVKPEISFYDIKQELDKTLRLNGARYNFYKKYDKASFYVISGVNWKKFISFELLRSVPFLIILLFSILLAYFLHRSKMKTIIEKYTDCFHQKSNTLLASYLDTAGHIEKFDVKDTLSDTLSHLFHDISCKHIKVLMKIERTKFLIEHNAYLIHSIFLLLLKTVISVLSEKDKLTIHLSKKSSNDKLVISLCLKTTGLLLSPRFFFMHMVDISKEYNFHLEEEGFKSLFTQEGIQLNFSEGKVSEIEILLHQNPPSEPLAKINNPPTNVLNFNR
jgi:hypothetical protein